MATEFGKELRKLRIDEDETLADMAEKLGISMSYLSAIEIGTRSVPSGLIEKLSAQYKLNKEAVETLNKALEQSISSIDISLQSTLPLQRDLAIMLARKLPDLSDSECEKMLSILKEGK